MQKRYTKQELEAQLKAKTEAITQRLQTAKTDLVEAGEDVTDRLRKYPVAIAFGAVALGALAGAIYFRTRSKKSSSNEPEEVHSEKEVQEALKAGKQVVVYHPKKSWMDHALAPAQGILSGLVGQVVKMGASLLTDVVQEKLQQLAQKSETDPETTERMVERNR